MSEVPLLSRLVPALATERLHTDAAMIDESRRSLAATMISEILHVAKAGAIARGDGKVTIKDIRTAASIHSAVRRSRQETQALQHQQFTTPPPSPPTLPVSLLPRPLSDWADAREEPCRGKRAAPAGPTAERESKTAKTGSAPLGPSNGLLLLTTVAQSVLSDRLPPPGKSHGGGAAGLHF